MLLIKVNIVLLRLQHFFDLIVDNKHSLKSNGKYINISYNLFRYTVVFENNKEYTSSGCF